MRASGSSTPSNLPIGVLNCERTRAYAPVAREPSLPAAIDIDGSEIERPAARHSTSIRQPVAHLRLAADHPLHRDEDVLARSWARS